MYTKYITITIPSRAAHTRHRRRHRSHSVFTSGLFCILTVFCILSVCAATRISSAAPVSYNAAETAESCTKTAITKTPLNKAPAEHEVLTKPAELDMSVPSEETGQKTFMDYRTITSTTSDQYALQQDAVTNELGLRELDGRYMVAMGTYYGTVGDIFRITMENGSVFEVIMGDVKSDANTDETKRHRNGNVLEFIVDGDYLSDEVWYHGDVSYAAGFLSGQIDSITKLLV